MPKRIKDLAVKTGSYTDNQGNKKNRYHNIGVMMEGDDGGHYMLLDPMVNLAAVPREAGKDRVMVSMFDPKQEGQQYQAAPQRQQPQVPADDIPF